MHDQRPPPPWKREERYLGLTPAAFDAVVLLIVGSVVAGVCSWLFAFGGLETVGLSEGDEPANRAVEQVPTPATATSTIPPFEWGACKFDVPVRVTVDCGNLMVPEDRSKPDSRTIRLHVGIYRSEKADKAPDPVLYLGGGPGENSTEASSIAFDGRIKPFLEARDFIVLDQRGAGYSQPALDCPELIEVYKEHIDEDLTLEGERSLGRDAIARCRDRLLGEGVSLAAYRSYESAADIRDLRLALGLDQWNIYGVSYGTRLALTVMRDHPHGIRSAILDSTYPLQADLYSSLAPNARRAFDTFFNGCASDPDCDSTYSDLEGVFFRLVDELNSEPLRLTIVNPITEETFESTVIDGDGLVEFLFQSLYSTELIPVLPTIIYQVESGDTSLLARILGAFVAEIDYLTPGMHFSVQCSDEVLFSSPEAVAQGIDAFPELRALTEGDAFSGTGVFDVCQGWGAAPADPKENEPVTSDIPTLVMSGEYDPITPPEWGQLTAATLSHRFLYIFPGSGHGVATDGGCASGIVMSFLADPSIEPDATCLGEMGGPNWFLY